jgi:hypothetical protein
MLMKFLKKGLAMGCDSIEIEYKDRKEWIFAFSGSVGYGIGCLDPDEAKSMFKEIDDLRKQKEEKKLRSAAPSTGWPCRDTRVLGNGSIGSR